MVPPEQRRLRADAARNRQLLIDAAQRLFTDSGLGVTLDDIAREAGVNVATAYRHFANKHELAEAFIEQSIERTVEMAEHAAAADDPWQGVVEFLEQSLELLAGNRGLADIFTRLYGDAWFDRVRERMDGPVEQLLHRAQDAGVVRTDVATHDFGVLVPMLGSVIGLDAGRDPLLARRYLSLVLAGLRPSDVPLVGSPPTAEQMRAAVAQPTGLPARPVRTAAVARVPRVQPRQAPDSDRG